jgi:hypothetical protein
MRRAAFLLFLAIPALMAPPAAAAGGDRDPRLLPRDASVGGRTYRQWDVLWGRTQSKTPVTARRSLLVNRDGRRCGVQIGRVRLLPASMKPGPRLNLRCSVRPGTFLVLPVTGFASNAESPEGLAAEVRQAFRGIRRAELRINGRKTGRPGHIVETPNYRVVLPARNGWGLPAGPEWFRSRDYWAILSPPGRGTHVITTLGVVDPPGDDPQFSIGIRYRITVAG